MPPLPIFVYLFVCFIFIFALKMHLMYFVAGKVPLPCTESRIQTHTHTHTHTYTHTHMSTSASTSWRLKRRKAKANPHWVPVFTRVTASSCLFAPLKAQPPEVHTLPLPAFPPYSGFPAGSFQRAHIQANKQQSTQRGCCCTVIKLAFLKNLEINDASHHHPVTPCLRKVCLDCSLQERKMRQT